MNKKNMESIDLDDLINGLSVETLEFPQDILERDIYIFEEISRDTSIRVCNQIRAINKDDLELKMKNKDYIPEPINIFIDTFGGEVNAGFSIITAIKQSQTKVRGVVTGVCYSMGVPILIACDERHSSTFATLMLHSVSVELMYGRSFHDYHQQAVKLSETNRRVKNFIVSEIPDIDEDFIENILSQDKDEYIEPEKALELGIIHDCNFEKNGFFESDIQYVEPKEKEYKKSKNIKWKSKSN